MSAKPAVVEPIEVDCPDCQARAGWFCTVPTDAGRRTVRWFHVARDDAAAVAYWETRGEIADN